MWQRSRDQARQARIKRDYSKKVVILAFSHSDASYIGGEGCKLQTLRPLQGVCSGGRSWSRSQHVVQVLKVGSNVYVAIGYGLANSVMVEGEEGVVIIDTLESCEVARWNGEIFGQRV